MGIMRSAAVKGIIPPGNKVTELRENIYNIMVVTPKVLEEQLGQQGLDALSEVARQLGNSTAEELKGRLGFGETLKDSADSWKVLGHVLGTKMSERWITEDRVEFDHEYCPQHEAFVKSGKLYCDTMCLPLMEALASGVAPRVKMELVRAADEKDACIKGLVFTYSESE
ncbi:MAG: hypothetical protein RTU30_09855 [Candidatus Thorarchaeota archaeon]